MPLGPGVRYRVKHTPKGNIRLAFRGNKVIEATKMPKAKGSFKKENPSGLQARMADLKSRGQFKKKRRSA
jgi:hypothetical protein